MTGSVPTAGHSLTRKRNGSTRRGSSLSSPRQEGARHEGGEAQDAGEAEREAAAGVRMPGTEEDGTGCSAALAGGAVPTLHAPPSCNPPARCFSTCYKESSSVTDHRRLMYVAILAQLSEHEGRDVLPRYSGGSVGISAEKDLVLTRGRFVGEPGRAHDHPL